MRMRRAPLVTGVPTIQANVIGGGIGPDTARPLRYRVSGAEPLL